MQQTQNNTQNKLRINFQIKAYQVQLIDSDGTNLGTVSITEALKKAQEQNLDLVEINPRLIPPVCKLTDFGKMQYEQKKQEKAAKKNQKANKTSQIEFRPVTDLNDLNTKLTSVKGFLGEGNKVRLVCKFRGREMMHTQLGKEKLEWFIEQCQDLIAAAPLISMEGRDMSVIISPKATK